MTTPIFNVGFTSKNGIVIPAASSSDRVPATLQGLFDGSNGGKGLDLQTVPDFDSYSLLTAAYPNKVATLNRPAFAQVRGGKKYQWVGSPYNLWGPLPGYTLKRTISGRTDATPTVSGIGDSFGVTQTVNLPQYPWPVIYEITFRALMVAAVSTDRCNIYLRLNGGGVGYFQVAGSGSGVSIASIINEGSLQDAPPTSIVGGIEKASGAGVTTVTANDDRFTSIDVLIRPYYEQAEF